MPLTHGQRGQDREDPPAEHRSERGAVVGVEGVPVGQDDAGGGEGRPDLAEEEIAVALHQLGGPGGDGGQLLGGTHAVRRRDLQAGGHLILQSRYPHLEELVEPLGEDGQVADPFQQREATVGHQIEEPGPEVQPRELAVDEPSRIGQRGHGTGRDRPRPRRSEGVARVVPTGGIPAVGGGHRLGIRPPRSATSVPDSTPTVTARVGRGQEGGQGYSLVGHARSFGGPGSLTRRRPGTGAPVAPALAPPNSGPTPVGSPGCRC